jgi:LPXTG-motif cell wall-anchored protein
MHVQTTQDWLVLFGLAILALGWWVSFRIVRERRIDSGTGLPWA